MSEAAETPEPPPAGKIELVVTARYTGYFYILTPADVKVLSGPSGFFEKLRAEAGK